MIDALYMFSDGQTSLGSNTASTYYADLTGATQGKDAFGNSINIPLSAGKLYLNVLVTVAVASAALTVDLYTAANTTINASDTKVCGMSIPSGTVAGEMFSIGVDMQSATWLRYMGVVYDGASAGVGAATGVDCWLDTSPVTTQKLPD
jgi:hypothetical protein